MKQIFENKIVAALLTVLRVWLGVQWLKAGFGKVSTGFDASGFIQGAIAKSQGENAVVQGWYASFLETVALPNSGLFSFLVAWGELLVGLGLVLGALTIPALVAGGFMNLSFLWAGTISLNPTLLLVAVLLLVMAKSAAYFGIDRLYIPTIKKDVENRRLDPAIGTSAG
ncbi:DoxX family membrane protein [Sporosarcina thermotolerans]|uniref:DoxX family membrane protein n=1 Tax=Sporosarcina thermotolerans TaxID=633404 RepID=A0AAW9ABZ7_9BACL|nr:DoxX family membrane protein [Sporosarcina thermotolerans]MDW0116666.1 DoxX family membrane protein [Sporosarcina thermotolerans]